FPFFKFRSMVVNAEAMRRELDDANEADGVLFKMRDDPRITPFGHFIRKYSIDELPQLWNVIRGDMNLVGPRPLPTADLEGADCNPEVSYWMDMRQKVRPGITGSWQVSGRSDLGFEAMVNHDIAYVQDWTFWQDIVILIKTMPAVLKGRGAR
ncbi:MAG: exopolysaccharide biosynthesis polyprenyl glycosylphosphotransferase, partial [Oligoflexia bacterium]|nr:exopolysaccharide biosynthesis polyprenyl glycosylphosphotransferase [Oligoflexia bacterium]